MRVLFLTSWYPSERAPEAFPFVREHARAVAAAGHDIRVLVVPDPRDHPDAPRDLVQLDQGMSLGIPTWSAQVAPRRLPHAGYLSSCRLVVATAHAVTSDWQPDVLHSHSLDAAPTAQWLAQRMGIPHLHTAHWSNLVTNELTAAQRIKLRLGVHRADAVLPVSEFLATTPGVRRSRGWTGVVPNAVDVERLRRFDSDVTRTSGLVTWIGSWREVKNPQLALAAADMLAVANPDVRLRMIGPTRPEGVPERDHVSWLGPVPHDQIPDLLRSSSALWSTSRLETFGVAVLEAIVAGVPVVVTPVGALPELVDGTNGQFAATAHDFAQATTDILEGRWRLNPDAARLAGERYGHAAVGEQLTRAYRRCLG